MNPRPSVFSNREGKAPKEVWGEHLSGCGINVTILHPHEPQLNAKCCVALNQIDSSHMICIRFSVVLGPHCSTLCSALPFRFDKISRKGQVFRSFQELREKLKEKNHEQIKVGW